MLTAGAGRNFEVFGPQEFIAAYTQHIPPKHFSLVRYIGWYSSRSRGERAKKEKLTRGGDGPGRFTIARYRRDYRRTWAMLISRVYQVDPLRCEKCGGAMRVVSVITPIGRAAWSGY